MQPRNPKRTRAVIAISTIALVGLVPMAHAQDGAVPPINLPGMPAPPESAQAKKTPAPAATKTEAHTTSAAVVSPKTVIHDTTTTPDAHPHHQPISLVPPAPQATIVHPPEHVRQRTSSAEDMRRNPVRPRAAAPVHHTERPAAPAIKPESRPHLPTIRSVPPIKVSRPASPAAKPVMAPFRMISPPVSRPTVEGFLSTVSPLALDEMRQDQIETYKLGLETAVAKARRELCQTGYGPSNECGTAARQRSHLSSNASMAHLGGSLKHQDGAAPFSGYPTVQMISGIGHHLTALVSYPDGRRLRVEGATREHPGTTLPTGQQVVRVSATGVLIRNRFGHLVQLPSNVSGR